MNSKPLEDAERLELQRQLKAAIDRFLNQMKKSKDNHKSIMIVFNMLLNHVKNVLKKKEADACMEETLFALILMAQSGVMINLSFNEGLKRGHIKDYKSFMVFYTT